MYFSKAKNFTSLLLASTFALVVTACSTTPQPTSHTSKPTTEAKSTGTPVTNIQGNVQVANGVSLPAINSAAYKKMVKAKPYITLDRNYTTSSTLNGHDAVTIAYNCYNSELVYLQVGYLESPTKYARVLNAKLNKWGQLYPLYKAINYTRNKAAIEGIYQIGKKGSNLQVVGQTLSVNTVKDNTFSAYVCQAITHAEAKTFRKYLGLKSTKLPE